MEILPVGAELFHADGRTDGRTDKQIYRQKDRHDEANSRFSQFLNAPENFSTFRRPQGVSNEKEYKHQYINPGSAVTSNTDSAADRSAAISVHCTKAVYTVKKCS